MKEKKLDKKEASHSIFCPTALPYRLKRERTQSSKRGTQYEGIFLVANCVTNDPSFLVIRITVHEEHICANEHNLIRNMYSFARCNRVQDV